MVQRKIVLYLARRRLTAIVILIDLGYTFGSDVIGYSTIIRYPREDRSLNSNRLICFTNSESEADDRDLVILLALD
jgi:hypothetical protein